MQHRTRLVGQVVVVALCLLGIVGTMNGQSAGDGLQDVVGDAVRRGLTEAESDALARRPERDGKSWMTSDLPGIDDPSILNLLSAEARTLDLTEPVFASERDGVTVLEDGGKLAGGGVTNTAAILRAFYQDHPDVYDHVFIFSSRTFPADIEPESGFAFTFAIQNRDSGIGRAIFDRSGDFWLNTTRLRAVSNMNDTAEYPLYWFAPFLPGPAESTVEILGRQLALAQGAMTAEQLAGLLGLDTTGLVVRLSTGDVASVVDGQMWRDNADGTFTALESPRGYSALDMYFMGLGNADAVQNAFLIFSEASPQKAPVTPGTTINGWRVDLSGEMIVEALGQRVPAAEDGIRTLRAAFVLVAPDGAGLLRRDLSKLNTIRSRLEDWHGQAAGQRSRLDTGFDTDGTVLRGTAQTVVFEDLFPQPPGCTRLCCEPDPTNWVSNSPRACVDDLAWPGSYPSAPYALHFDGQDMTDCDPNADPNGPPGTPGDGIASVAIDLGGTAAANLSYFFQRQGQGNAPDAGKDLIVEYRNSASLWIEVNRHLGSGSDGSPPNFPAVGPMALPSGALHSNFALRFRNIATPGPFDDWFIDNVVVETIEAPRLLTVASVGVTEGVTVEVVPQDSLGLPDDGACGVLPGADCGSSQTGPGGDFVDPLQYFSDANGVPSAVTLHAEDTVIDTDLRQYPFYRWRIDGINDSPPDHNAHVTMDEDHLAEAVYGKLAVSCSEDPNGVYVGVDTPDLYTAETGSMTPFRRAYALSQVVDLNAPPEITVGADTKRIDRWDLDGAPQTSHDPVLRVTMDRPREAYATYVTVQRLEVRSNLFNPGATIQVSVADYDGLSAGVADPNNFDRVYVQGTQVTLTAVDTDPPSFVRWKLDGNNQDPPNPVLTVDMSEDHQVEAVYEARRSLQVQAVSVSGDPNGTPLVVDIEVDPVDVMSQPPGGTGQTPLDLEYVDGEFVELKAPKLPNVGGTDYIFRRWEIAGQPIPDAQCDPDFSCPVVLVMDQDFTGDSSVVAIYVPRYDVKLRSLKGNNPSNPSDPTLVPFPGVEIDVDPIDGRGLGESGPVVTTGDVTDVPEPQYVSLTYGEYEFVTMQAPTETQGEVFEQWILTNAMDVERLAPDPDPTVARFSVLDPTTFDPLATEIIADALHITTRNLHVQSVFEAGVVQFRRVNLFNRVGGNGDNMINTVFDSLPEDPNNPPPSINDPNASAPFTGTYQPVENLGLFEGLDAQTTWTLEVFDASGGFTGTLESWSVKITGSIGQPVNKTSTDTDPNGIAIPDLGGITSSIKFTANLGAVTEVEVTVNIAHPNIGDLEAYLVAPRFPKLVEIQVFPSDVFGDGEEWTPFERRYRDGTTVTLTAPGSVQNPPPDMDDQFNRWRVGATCQGLVQQPLGDTQLDLLMDRDWCAEAVYIPARKLTILSNIQGSEDPSVPYTEVHVVPCDIEGNPCADPQDPHPDGGVGETDFELLYENFAIVTITAVHTYHPRIGEPFLRWEIFDTETGETILGDEGERTITLIMDRSYEITALYSALVVQTPVGFYGPLDNPDFNIQVMPTDRFGFGWGQPGVEESGRDDLDRGDNPCTPYDFETNVAQFIRSYDPIDANGEVPIITLIAPDEFPPGGSYSFAFWELDCQEVSEGGEFNPVLVIDDRNDSGMLQPHSARAIYEELYTLEIKSLPPRGMGNGASGVFDPDFQDGQVDPGVPFTLTPNDFLNQGDGVTLDPDEAGFPTVRKYSVNAVPPVIVTVTAPDEILGDDGQVDYSFWKWDINGVGSVDDEEVQRTMNDNQTLTAIFSVIIDVRTSHDIVKIYLDTTDLTGTGGPPSYQFAPHQGASLKYAFGEEVTFGKLPGWTQGPNLEQFLGWDLDDTFITGDELVVTMNEPHELFVVLEKTSYVEFETATAAINNEGVTVKVRATNPTPYDPNGPGYPSEEEIEFVSPPETFTYNEDTTIHVELPTVFNPLGADPNSDPEDVYGFHRWRYEMDPYIYGSPVNIDLEIGEDKYSFNTRDTDLSGMQIMRAYYRLAYSLAINTHMDDLNGAVIDGVDLIVNALNGVPGDLKGDVSGTLTTPLLERLWYTYGRSIKLEAQPSVAGLWFVGWKADDPTLWPPTVPLVKEYTVSGLGKNLKFGAIYEESNTLTVRATPLGTGLVSVVTNPDAPSSSKVTAEEVISEHPSVTPPLHTAAYNRRINCEALAEPGYQFSRWVVDPNGAGSFNRYSRVILVNADMDKFVTARFVLCGESDLAVSSNLDGPPHNGIDGIIANLSDMNGDTTGRTEFVLVYDGCEEVTLTAPLLNDDQTMHFLRWKVDGSDEDDDEREVTVNMVDPHDVEAVYVDLRTLTIDSMEAAHINVTPSDAFGQGATMAPPAFERKYRDLLEVTVQAPGQSQQYSEFYRWVIDGGPGSSTDNPITITMNGDRSLTAEWGEGPQDGACCEPNGACTIKSEVDCIASGGTWQGAGTVCVPDPCNDGACCEPNGACHIETEAVCLAGGGTWLGAGTICVPDPCNDGACCEPNGACTIKTGADCVAGGGTWQGAGTSCTPDPCNVGACCIGGSCTQETEADCVGQGGTWMGIGVPCSPDPCNDGACCEPNGACTIKTEAVCLAGGGSWLGAGTDCNGDPCNEEEGACCQDFGVCTSETQAACDTLGGVYQGDGVLCANVECDACGVITTGLARFDADDDCDVDLADFLAFQTCFSGPGGSLDPGCECFDANDDGDADLGDFLDFQTAYTGPGGGCP